VALPNTTTQGGEQFADSRVDVSDMFGKRPKFARMLSDPSAKVIVVEASGSVGMILAERLQAALAAKGRRVVVVDTGTRPPMMRCAR
jgi:predicted site-specific integrase-resolvase